MPIGAIVAAAGTRITLWCARLPELDRISALVNGARWLVAAGGAEHFPIAQPALLNLPPCRLADSALAPAIVAACVLAAHAAAMRRRP